MKKVAEDIVFLPFEIDSYVIASNFYEREIRLKNNYHPHKIDIFFVSAGKYYTVDIRVYTLRVNFPFLFFFFDHSVYTCAQIYNGLCVCVNVGHSPTLVGRIVGGMNFSDNIGTPPIVLWLPLQTPNVYTECIPVDVGRSCRRVSLGQIKTKLVFTIPIFGTQPGRPLPRVLCTTI